MHTGIAAALALVAALLLAGSPQYASAQLSDGGLAVPSPKAVGKAGAAPAPLSAESIAGSISGAALGTVSTGNIDIQSAGKSAGTIVKPPRTPPKITVAKAPAAPTPPAAGPLATCVFNVQGKAPKSPGTAVSVSSSSTAVAEGTAAVTCTGPGAPIKLYGADQSKASFQTKLTGVTFLTNTLGGPRPVLLFNKLNIRIEDSTFAYIAGTPYTLVFNDSNVEVVNTTFIGNRGTPEGVISGFNSFFNFTNTNFTSNQGAQTGAITINDGAAEFDGCTFDGNKGDQANSGAVLVGRGSTATFRQTVFTNNQGNAAGAILAYQGSTLNINQSTFSGNVATNNGGAIQQLGGEVSIGSSFFSKNVAASIGGAYFGANVRGTIADTDFWNNTAVNGQGGGVYVQIGAIDVSNCRFLGNKGQAGAGLYFRTNDGTVDQCSFEGNVATNSGGGISQASGNGNVTNSIFVGNSAVNLGGGLYQNNQTGGVSSCLFSANVATQEFSGQGAGIFRNGMNGDISNIFFDSNQAALNGGGLYMIASIGTVENSTFLSNAATSGAAVYAFNCAGRINSNAFANEPLDAVAIDHSIGFTEKSLTTGRINAPVAGLVGDTPETGAAAAAALGPDTSGLRRLLL